MRTTFQLIAFVLCSVALQCGREEPIVEKTFFRGADLSYINEMEDCGAVYRENGQAKDPYAIFAENGCSLVRLRLWHTPSWYDTLNQGHRYGDFADVRRSIQRARALNMPVLLDFHLSDFWADPGRQLAPAAWLPVVHDLPVLKDSVYNYVLQTLLRLNADGLLPEIVQIGNETNRGILLSPQDNASGGAIDWDRNAALFQAGISAVREAARSTGKEIRVALHIAGPQNANNLMVGFWTHGVQDFDIIGISYYWAWHKPTTIAETGSIISQLRSTYPGKDVMILETGYIWTTESNDQANNVINELHPDYSPASPANQRKWLADLSREVEKQGGIGVLCWEPAWVSTSCRTPWGQGSHQENAAFFDFDNNVLPDGGMGWFRGE